MSDRQKALETEMEATRQELAANIDQLVYRAHPKTIVRRQADSAKAYFVDSSGAPRQDNILKVAGAVAGVILLFVVVRKVAR